METVTLGILGAGRIGRVHMESLSGTPGVRIKRVADPFLDEDGSTWASSMGVEIAGTDPDEVLTDPDIDAVLICSSTDTHADFTIRAARAGKHIFCEKPLDHDLGRIREALAAVQDAGVKFQIGFNRRFDHNFRALKHTVDAGSIGDLHILKITSRDPEPPNPAYIGASGGMFMDMTIHDFDMVRYLSGAEVVDVFAKGAVLVDPEIGKAGDIDTAVVTMNLSSGAIAVIDNSRKAAYGYDQRAEVFGSKGAAETANDSASSVKLSNGTGVHGEKPLFFFLERYMESYRQEMDDFLTALRTGGEVPAGGVDALRPVEIAMAANESLKLGRAVRIEEISKAAVGDGE